MSGMPEIRTKPSTAIVISIGAFAAIVIAAFAGAQLEKLLDSETLATGILAVWCLLGCGAAIAAIVDAYVKPDGETLGLATTVAATLFAILALAALRRSDFEWYAHERVGRRAGLSDAEMADLRDGGSPGTFSEQERVVLDASRALATAGDLDDEAFAVAVGRVHQPLQRQALHVPRGEHHQGRQAPFLAHRFEHGRDLVHRAEDRVAADAPARLAGAHRQYADHTVAGRPFAGERADEQVRPVARAHQQHILHGT